MSTMYKLSRPLRKVGVIRGLPEPVYTASATALQMARRLESMNLDWELSPHQTSIMPTQDVFNQDGGYLHLDAYTCCHSHDTGANTHVAQYGVVIYRYQVPDAFIAAMCGGSDAANRLEAASIRVSGCPYLSLGARIIMARLAAADWTPSWEDFSAPGYKPQDVAARTTSADGKSWLAVTELASSSFAGEAAVGDLRYFYVALRVNDYAVARNGYIEGAAIVSGDLELTFTAAVEGYSAGSDISIVPPELAALTPAPDTAPTWTPCLNYSSGGYEHADAQIVAHKHLYAYNNSSNKVSPVELSFPVLADESIDGIATDLYTRGDVSAPAGDPFSADLTVSTESTAIGIMSIGPDAGAKIAYAVRRLATPRAFSRLRLGTTDAGAVVTAPSTASAVINLYACGVKDGAVEALKVRLASAMGLPSMLDIALAPCDVLDTQTGLMVEKANRRSALLHSLDVRYGERGFVRAYLAAGKTVGSTVQMYAPPRVETWRHLTRIDVAAGKSLAGGSEVEVAYEPDPDDVAVSLLVVCSIGQIENTASLESLASMQVKCNLAVPWSVL